MNNEMENKVIETLKNAGFEVIVTKNGNIFAGLNRDVNIREIAFVLPEDLKCNFYQISNNRIAIKVLK